MIDMGATDNLQSQRGNAPEGAREEFSSGIGGHMGLPRVSNSELADFARPNQPIAGGGDAIKAPRNPKCREIQRRCVSPTGAPCSACYSRDYRARKAFRLAEGAAYKRAWERCESENTALRKRFKCAMWSAMILAALLVGDFILHFARLP